MMNVFYYDRITTCLEEVEAALPKMNYSDAKRAAEALAEIRDLVDTVRTLSKHTENIWNQCAYEVGQTGEMRPAPVDPRTGTPFTYVDQWAARYELIRREITRRLDRGYSIQLIPPAE